MYSTMTAESERLYIKFDGSRVEYIDSIHKDIKCGDIWIGNLPENNGCVQCGKRPLFIISNDKNNQYSNVVNVIPLTTKMNKRKLPCHVEIWDHKRYGLSEPSTMMCEQIQTIPKENIAFKVGEIRDTNMLIQICKAMQIQFPVMNIL